MEQCIPTRKSVDEEPSGLADAPPMHLRRTFDDPRCNPGDSRHTFDGPDATPVTPDAPSMTPDATPVNPDSHIADVFPVLSACVMYRRI